MEPKGLTEQAQDIWDQNAAFWDDRYGEGNAFQKLLIGPATERLLGLKPGELVLDIACGNGAFSRRMAELGARVVACDFSARFLERAQERTTKHADRIEYRQIDATDEGQLLALGKRRFDAAVCTMALMDMAEIEPLISALGQLLKPGGRFIFSIMHPCFNRGSGCNLMAEEVYKDGELVTVYSVKISEYIRPSTAKGLGMIGQPAPQYYFDRPISALLAPCFQAGMVLDGLEEPVFAEPIEGRWLFSWSNYQEIPPVLVARLRLL
jgi:2-polyprenyl-3-methyl-5-hydroxy-6-metoxy-1,4-benzoquinol methylase